MLTALESRPREDVITRHTLILTGMFWSHEAESPELNIWENYSGVSGRARSELSQASGRAGYGWEDSRRCLISGEELPWPSA